MIYNLFHIQMRLGVIFDQTHASHRYLRRIFPSKTNYQEGFMVKGRNEPCKVVNIAEILAALHERDIEEISREIYENTMKLFFSYS